MRRRFIVVAGPTASGKTRISVALAQALDSCVISADSMQIYRGMDIGTAKATAEERAGVPHYMLDIVEPDETYTVAQYQQDAFAIIEKINSSGRVPIVAGGTGLYINALVNELNFGSGHQNDNIRQKYAQLANDKGCEYLYNELKRRDPQYAHIIAKTDRRRIIRRLELIETCGVQTYDFRRPNTRDDYLIIGLTLPREMLYERINARVDAMMAAGLADEARRIYERYGETGALKAIGYKELVCYFKGDMTLKEATELIKRNTRRYAKRQLTWFRRDERIRWFDICSYLCLEDTIHDIMTYMKGKGF